MQHLHNRCILGSNASKRWTRSRENSFEVPAFQSHETSIASCATVRSRQHEMPFLSWFPPCTVSTASRASLHT